ncbi:Uncharacterised protein [Mycobacteroides abscessus subsp. massiliense]|nr:Uncharacterised protein [Mycobacteroides abscessus subsp. massiliense]
MRTIAPRTLRKLVDAVSRQLAEEVHQLVFRAWDDVHCQVTCLPRSTPGVVLLGQPREKQRRIDTDLAGESDKTTRGTIGPSHRHHIHRLIQLAHKAGELGLRVVFRRGHACHLDLRSPSQSYPVCRCRERVDGLSTTVHGRWSDCAQCGRGDAGVSRHEHARGGGSHGASDHRAFSAG